jgi:restriction system protein
MPLPTYDQLMLPLMKLLAEQERAIKISEAAELLAQRSRLSEEDLNKSLPSGKNIFKDRVSWAKTYLVKAGLIKQPQRAFCEISDLGKTIDLDNLSSITNEFLAKFDGFSEFKLGRAENLDMIHSTEKSFVELNLHNNKVNSTPEEIIQTTTELLLSNLKIDLLKLVKENSPSFFEKLVVDLLVEMG